MPITNSLFHDWDDAYDRDADEYSFCRDMQVSDAIRAIDAALIGKRRPWKEVKPVTTIKKPKAKAAKGKDPRLVKKASKKRVAKKRTRR